MKRYNVCHDSDGHFIDITEGKYENIELLLYATSKQNGCRAVYEFGVIITDLPDDYELCSHCNHDHEYDGPGEKCKDRAKEELLTSLEDSAVGSREGYTDPMPNKKPEAIAVYNSEIKKEHLDPLHDANDAIACLVHQFVTRNSFSQHIGALSDTTPNQWNAQLNFAARCLEDKLEEILTEVGEDLHSGEFWDAALHCVKPTGK